MSEGRKRSHTTKEKSSSSSSSSRPRSKSKTKSSESSKITSPRVKVASPRGGSDLGSGSPKLSKKQKHRRRRSRSFPNAPVSDGLAAKPEAKRASKSPKRGGSRLIVAGETAEVPQQSDDDVASVQLESVDMDDAAAAIEAEMLKWREKKEADHVDVIADPESLLEDATEQMKSAMSSWEDKKPSTPTTKRKSAKSLQRTISVSLAKAKGQLLRSPGSTASIPSVKGDEKDSEKEEESEEEVLMKVNARLASEGKQMITMKERRWLLQRGAEDDDVKAANDSPARKKKATSRKDLALEVDKLQRELNRSKVSSQATVQVKEMLTEEVATLNDKINKLEEELTDSKNTNETLNLRLDVLSKQGSEREEAVMHMESQMQAKIDALTETEKDLSRKLRTSVAAQSRMEKQMLQMRGGSVNLEQEKRDMEDEVDRANAEVGELKQKLKWSTKENESRKTNEAKLNEDLTELKQDVKDAYAYMDLLEATDVQLRTAVAIVQKQNRAFAQINNNLKKQLGEAQAALAMQQMYLDGEDGDLDVSDLLDQADIQVADNRVDEDGVPLPPEAPDLPGATPTSSFNILASIPNYVAKRKAAQEDEESKPQVDMVDMFTQALIERRTQITEEDEESSDEEWDD